MIPFLAEKAIPWRLVGIGAAILAFCAVLTFAGCEHSNAKSARADEKVAIEGKNTAVDANESLLATVDIYKSTIDVWKRLATPSAKMKEKAAVAQLLEQEVIRLSAELDKRAEEDYADPDCNALLNTDFELVCPHIADGLRDRAGRYENRSRRDPGAGGGEDRSIFD